jgi:hypothetical protein
MKKNDIKLIMTFAILGAICMIAIYFLKQTGGSVIVTIDGQEYGTYPLNKEATIEIESKYGTNLLVIKDHKAKITEATCPDKLCVHQKSISKTGESIVCLPHKLVITVINGEENELDAVSQ